MAQSAADCVPIKHANALLKAVTNLDELGINLDLSVETVLEINSDAGSNLGIKRLKLLSAWLQSDVGASWDKLARVLFEMGYKAISAKIRKEFCPETVTTTLAPPVAESSSDNCKSEWCVQVPIQCPIIIVCSYRANFIIMSN